MSLNKIFINNSDTNYTHSIFDISEYTGREYPDLSSALADVPEGKQSGGMTVRYVQSSDNKYVRYNLLADSFTTNISQWAIDDVGVYVDNPEFIEAKTDSEGKLFEARRVDGTKVEYGDLEVEGIIKNNNLQEKFDSKINKIQNGINNEDTLSFYIPIENPEWLSVTTDSVQNVIGGIKKDGEPVLYRKNIKKIIDLVLYQRIKDKYRYIVPTFINGDSYLTIFGSDDLRTFDVLFQAGETYETKNTLRDNIKNTLRDPSIIKIGDYYYLVYTIIAFNSGSNKVGFCRTKDFINWEELDNLGIYGNHFGIDDENAFDKIWAPSWFRDGNDVYVVSTAFTAGGGVSTVIMQYNYYNHTLFNGHDVFDINGYGLVGYDYHIYKENGYYYALGKGNAIYKSTTLYGTWTLLRNPQEETEGSFAIKLDNNKWRVFRQNLQDSSLQNAHMVYSDISSLENEIPVGVEVSYTNIALSWIRNVNGNNSYVEAHHWTIFDFNNRNDNNNNYTE